MPEARGKVGYLSVKAFPREARLASCYVDGADVTNRCYAADDIAGYADCFVHDAHGRVILAAGGDVKRERLHGDVVIDFPKGLD